MNTGHTSTPIRISGKIAALLPTCPYATEDWIDKIVVTAAILRAQRSTFTRQRASLASGP